MSQYSHHEINQAQYDDKFCAYASSQVHAQGAEFEKMRSLIAEHQLRHVLDLGCGGGHVSYHIAPVAESVVAYDLSSSMVENVLATAAQKNLNNITGQVGAAEQLPFADGYFDGIISRYSAHHWQSMTHAMNEIHRVLAPAGKAVFVDVIGSANPVLNNFLQTIESIRDPSHVRDYHLAEWIAMAEQAQFVVERGEKQRIHLDFGAWVTRMQTPAASQDTIRLLQQNASNMVKSYFNVQADGSFESDVIYLQLSKLTP